MVSKYRPLFLVYGEPAADVYGLSAWASITDGSDGWLHRRYYSWLLLFLYIFYPSYHLILRVNLYYFRTEPQGYTRRQDHTPLLLPAIPDKPRPQSISLPSSLWVNYMYLKVTIIYRYIFLWFWLKTHFVSTKFCNLYAEMVQGRQTLMFYTAIVLIANVCGYKILRFLANPQKYQTLVPVKISHLKVTLMLHVYSYSENRNWGGGWVYSPNRLDVVWACSLKSIRQTLLKSWQITVVSWKRAHGRCTLH